MFNSPIPDQVNSSVRIVKLFRSGMTAFLIVALISGCASASGRTFVYAAPQPQSTYRTPARLTAQRTAMPTRTYRLPSERDGSVTLGRGQKTPPGRVVVPKRVTSPPQAPANEITVESVEPAGPQLGAPRSKKQTMQPLDGPVLGAPERAPHSEIELDIKSPSRSQVGADITFELNVKNRTNAPIDQISIESEFDSALKFPGSERTRVRQKLGQLAADEERPIALTLVGDKEGTACSRFVVSVRGVEAVWKSVCVDVSAAQAGLKLIGPKVRYVGDRAEFTGKIVNTSLQPWKQVRAVCTHPDELVPREASTGVTQSDGLLTWNFGDLEPGEGVQLQVEFECAAAAQRAAIALQVSAEGGIEERCEAVLRSLPPKSGVKVRLSDTSDLINAGEETEYLVEFENSSPDEQSIRDFDLEIPDLFQVVSADIEPRDSQSTSREPQVSRNRVTLPTGFTVPGNRTTVVRVRVKGERPGDGLFRARWQPTDSSSNKVIELDEPTTVNR